MLVDTHVLLWLLDDDARLGAHARRWLDEAHSVKVSTASLWELAIKRQLGKLAAPDDLPARIESAGLEWLVVSPQHAWASQDLVGLLHRDPFDRLLLAQAAWEQVAFLTADRVILDAPVRPAVERCDARS